MARKKVKSRGRQKINMVKMENESNLQVTFSKRRTGLFKKASELCTLCAAQVAIIVFSPGQKVFSFGHPSVEAVIDRFLTRAPPPTGGTYQLIEAHRNATLKELNEQLALTEDMIEVERKNGVDIEKETWDRQKQRWWECPLEVLSLQQLEQLLPFMKSFKDNWEEKFHRILKEAVVPFGNVSMGVSVTIGGVGVGSSSSIVPFDHAGPSGSGGGVVQFGNVSMGPGVTLGCASIGSSSIVPFGAAGPSGSAGGAGFSFGNVPMGAGVTLGGKAVGCSSTVPFDAAGPSGFRGGGGVPFGNVSMGASTVTLGGGAAVGSSSIVPFDAAGASGSQGGGGVSFGNWPGGSGGSGFVRGGNVPFDTRAVRFNVSAPFDSRETGSTSIVPFYARASGSGDVVSFDNRASKSGNVFSFDNRASGFDMGGTLFDIIRASNFGGGASFNTGGASSSTSIVPLNAGEGGSTSIVPFDARASNAGYGNWFDGSESGRNDGSLFDIVRANQFGGGVSFDARPLSGFTEGGLFHAGTSTYGEGVPSNANVNEFTGSVPSDTINASAGAGAGAGFSFGVGGNEFNNDVPCDRANDFNSGLLTDIAGAGRYIGGASFDAGTSGPRGGVSFDVGAGDQSNDAGTSDPSGGVSFDAGASASNDGVPFDGLEEFFRSP